MPRRSARPSSSACPSLPGRVGHAEIKIGDSVLMLNDEYPDFGAKSPAAIGGPPGGFHMPAAEPQQAGATLMRDVPHQFYGDRSGMVACPFGYRWFLSAAKEVVSPEEMQRRWTRMLEGGKVE